MDTGDDNPFKLPDGPSAKVRRWTYAALWLPTLLLLFVGLPQFQPIFDKLAKTGQLPELTGWVLALVRANRSAYFIPALSFLPGLLILDTAVVALLLQGRYAKFLIRGWFIVGCFLAVGAFGMVISRLFFKFKT